MKINIGIADDHILVRKGFAALLKSYKNINVLFEAGNGNQLLECLEQHIPHIILLDIEMPALDGLKALPVIKERFPEIKIIVLSQHSEPGSIIEYVNLGAVSFLPKDCDIELLIKAIHGVHKSGIFFNDDVAGMLARAGATPKAKFKERKLTEHELLILKYFQSGKTQMEIAAILEISEKAVNYCRRVMLIKTHCEDLDSLLVYAKESKLI